MAGTPPGVSSPARVPIAQCAMGCPESGRPVRRSRSIRPEYWPSFEHARGDTLVRARPHSQNKTPRSRRASRRLINVGNPTYVVAYYLQAGKSIDLRSVFDGRGDVGSANSSRVNPHARVQYAPRDRAGSRGALINVGPVRRTYVFAYYWSPAGASDRHRSVFAKRRPAPRAGVNVGDVARSRSKARRVIWRSPPR